MFYLITNHKIATSYFETLEAMIRENIDYIIYREKDLSYARQKYDVLQIKKFVQSHRSKTKLIINSNIELAKEISADGIHLPLSLFLEYDGSFDGLVGVSLHHEYELKLIDDQFIDYFLVSHIFNTKCKEGVEPKGVELLSRVKNNTSKKVVALGGVNEKTYPELIHRKHGNIAMMSYIMAAEDPINQLNKLRAIKDK